MCLCSSKLYHLFLISPFVGRKKSNAIFVYVWNTNKSSYMLSSHLKEQNRAVSCIPLCPSFVASCFSVPFLPPAQYCFQLKVINNFSFFSNHINYILQHSFNFSPYVLSSFSLLYTFLAEHSVFILSPMANRLRIWVWVLNGWWIFLMSFLRPK